MRAYAHTRCMKRRLAHAARLFFSRDSPPDEPCAAVRRGEVIRQLSLASPLGGPWLRRASAGLVSSNCARAVADHVPRCCGAQRASTAVDAEQALKLDRRLVPMPKRTLFATRLRSRSVDGVWPTLLAASFTLFKEWRRGCAERRRAPRLQLATRKPLKSCG